MSYNIGNLISYPVPISEITEIVVNDASISKQYAIGKKWDGTDVVRGEAGFENNSLYYKDRSMKWAINPEDAPVEGSGVDSKYSSLHWSNKSQGHAEDSNAGALKSEGHAIGTQDNIPVESESPYWHNNSLYYKDKSMEWATNPEDVPVEGEGVSAEYSSLHWSNKSRGHAEDSNVEALKSEGYALGTQEGIPVESESPYYHNNSKYYSDNAISLIEGKADKIINPTSGDVVVVNGEGNIEDSSVSLSSMTEEIDTIKDKADKIVNPTAGDVIIVNGQGNIEDSSISLSSITNRLNTIESKIPDEASDINKLADMDYVNESIALSIATFRGTYNLITDLELPINATPTQISGAIIIYLRDHSIPSNMNDFVFVQIPTNESDPTIISRLDEYKYNHEDSTWKYEYSLNSNSFTSVQWDAINSGITETLVGTYSSHINDGSIHVTSTDKSNWNDKYEMPNGGIPKTDLDSSVQDSLSLADTAVQPRDIPTPSLKSSVTILVSDWNNKECTKTVTGITTDYSIIISPNPVSYNEYAICNVRCSDQSTDSLTFVCEDTPITDITINILCMDAKPLN